MKSLKEEIFKINSSISLEYNGYNRYMLFSKNDKSAFLFSTPIFNANNHKLVDLRFYKKTDAWYFYGSNSEIRICDHITLENAKCGFAVKINGCDKCYDLYNFNNQNIAIIPTLNGIALKSKEKFQCIISSRNIVSGTKNNDKYFAFMESEFVPYLTVNMVGGLDEHDNVITSCKMSYKKISEKEYMFTFEFGDDICDCIMAEINLYEMKLFQDTTVEKVCPETNNVFGSTAFIGYSKMYGEQKLYSRIDYSKFAELLNYKLKRILWYIPKLNSQRDNFEVFGIENRFCSYGSNWNNQVLESEKIFTSFENDIEYIKIDLTEYMIDKRTHYIQRRDGVVIKGKSDKYNAISTGDSYFSPQILEIDFY